MTKISGDWAQDKSVFWEYLVKLVAESEIIVDRPKGSAHPRYAEFVYPVAYGFLKGSQASDGHEVDIWVGTAEKEINGILCTIDPVKRDIETKIVYACSHHEVMTILQKMNEVLKVIYIPFNRR